MNYTSDFIEPYGTFVFDGSTTLASAKNMNKLGNQYTSGVYLIEHHNHDDNYFKKSEMDARYFNDLFVINSDADMVDGDHYTDLVGNGLPIGAVIGWESATMPAGFAIANGQTVNGHTTADLRDYFLPCAGGNITQGQTFGQNTQSLSGTFNIANHAITILEMANHAHTYIDTYVFLAGLAAENQGYYAQSVYTATDSGSQTSSSTGTGGSHNHNSGSSVTITNINFDNRPKFYGLYLIEKVV